MNELFELYEKAEIRIVTATVKSDTPKHKSRLVFATIRLLPKDVHQSYSTQVICGPDHTFYRKVVMPAKEAIQWYRTSNGTMLHTPHAGNQFNKPDEVSEYDIQIADFTDETTWGEFGIPLNEKNMLDLHGDNPAPFLGYNSARIHRRFGAQNELLYLADEPKVIEFIKQGVFIDLNQYREYIGGMVLILPNPIVKSIENRLLQTKLDGQEQELRLLKLNTYPSQSCEKLKLVNFEIYLGILKNFRTINIPANGVVAIPHENAYQSHGYFLVHEEYGCLEFMPATSYLRQVSFNSELIDSRLSVKTYENNKHTSAPYEYESSLAHVQKETVIGTIKSDEIYNRVVEARYQRDLDKKRLSSGQFWFESDQRLFALEKIGQIISEARVSVEFFDPYFDALQITQFSLRVRVKGVKVVIVTSKLAFPKIEDAKEMQKQINNVNDRKIGLDISCIVLNQNKPVLHDRFLTIDGTIWFIGHSFNQIGVKNSFMTKVSDSSSIFPQLERIKNHSESIDIKRYVDSIKVENNEIILKNNQTNDKNFFIKVFNSFIETVRK